MQLKSEQRLNELFLIIARDQFHYLKFILEGYDSLCTLSSEDINKGVIRICYPIEMQRQLFNLLESLAERLNPIKY